MITDTTPHRIPNMVRKLRSLLALRLETTCWKTSNMSAWQHDLVAGLQSAEHLYPRAVSHAKLDAHPAPPVAGAWIDDVDEGIPLLVVADRRLGHDERLGQLLEDDFRVGGHVGAQLFAWVLDRDLDLERRDVLLLHADRRDLCHLPVEDAIAESLGGNARELPETD